VHAAHQQGIVHRDLKPANVLLSADGTPKIADFGVAKHLNVDHGRTVTGAIVGTPSYMAPEQAEGRKDIGTPADVYALGAILYEFLSGRAPFEGESVVQTLSRVCTEPPEPLDRHISKLSRDLQTICMKCLEKDPRLRYASAEALARDLRRYLDGEPIEARPAAWPERVSKWARRRPAVAALSVLTLLVGVAGFIGVTWKWREAEYQKRAALAASESLERALYYSRVSLAYREWLSNNTATAEALLAACPARIRGWEWRYLQRLVDDAQTPLRGHNRTVQSVAFDPSGSRLATASDDRTIKIWNVSAGTLERTLSGHNSYVKAVAFSRDGRFLASASWDLTARIWDAATGELLRSLTGHASDVTAVAWSADGRFVATASKDKTLRVWNALTGVQRHVLTIEAAAALGVVFIGNDYLVSAGDDGTLELWSLAAERRQWKATAHRGPVRVVAVSPAGDVIASGGDEEIVRLWSRGGRAMRELRGHVGVVSALGFDARGKRLASASVDSSVRIWDLRSAQPLRALYGHTGAPTCVAFSPDGRLLASGSGGFGEGHTRLWDPETGRHVSTLGGAATEEARSLRGHSALVAALDYAPQGHTLASAAEDQSIRVWDTSAHRELLRIATPADSMQSVAWYPDGRTLVSGGRGLAVQVWDAADGGQRLRLAGHSAMIWSVALDPRGRLLASTGEDRQLRVWEAATGKLLHVLDTADMSPMRVLFTPDGARLIASGKQDASGLVRIWDVQKARELASLRAHSGAIFALALTRDGRRLATGGHDRVVKIWDLTSGREAREVFEPREVVTLSGHANHVHAIAFSPDGERIATAGCLDGAIRVWDSSGRLALALRGHTLGVFALAWSADGQQLASAGEDQIIKIWDAAPASAPAPVTR
jgi:WD40 repeat protein